MTFYSRSALVALALACAPSSALATSTINPNGSVTLGSTSPFTFTRNFNGFIGNNGPTVLGLTSSILFNFMGVSGNGYNFSYTLSNTSTAPIDAARVTIFGFNSDPNIVSATTGVGNLFDVIAAGNQPNGLSDVEICFKDAGSTGNCTGAHAGLAIGAATSGTFSLNYASALPQITLSDFSVRYQGISSQALGISGGSASGIIVPPPPPPPPVPEPSTWLQLILGFALLGGSLRYRKRPSEAVA